MAKRGTLVLLSGGLDSAVLLAAAMKVEGMANDKGGHVCALSINYGQRHHARELEAASALTDRYLGAGFRGREVADLSRLRHLFKPSALTSHEVAVPDGHYEDETMQATVVPNRNALFLSVAFAYAEALGVEKVGTAIHAGDHAIYPDCRPGFARAFEAMEFESLGPEAPRLWTPFVHMTKADIVKLGAEMGVPFELTWSCYKGGEVHCGTCGTCHERREAFQLAGVPDPTRYA